MNKKQIQPKTKAKKPANRGLVSFRLSKGDANFISGVLSDYVDNAREMDADEIRVFFGTRSNQKSQIGKAARLSKRFDRTKKGGR